MNSVNRINKKSDSVPVSYDGAPQPKPKPRRPIQQHPEHPDIKGDILGKRTQERAMNERRVTAPEPRPIPPAPVSVTSPTSDDAQKAARRAALETALEAAQPEIQRAINAIHGLNGDAQEEVVEAVRERLGEILQANLETTLEEAIEAALEKALEGVKETIIMKTARPVLAEARRRLGDIRRDFPNAKISEAGVIQEVHGKFKKAWGKDQASQDAARKAALAIMQTIQEQLQQEQEQLQQEQAWRASQDAALKAALATMQTTQEQLQQEQAWQASQDAALKAVATQTTQDIAQDGAERPGPYWLGNSDEPMFGEN
jgi:hypothetical protein